MGAGLLLWPLFHTAVNLIELQSTPQPLPLYNREDVLLLPSRGFYLSAEINGPHNSHVIEAATIQICCSARVGGPVGCFTSIYGKDEKCRLL